MVVGEVVVVRVTGAAVGRWAAYGATAGRQEGGQAVGVEGPGRQLR